MRRLALAACALLLTGCGGANRPAKINVTSPAFAPGGSIPREFTCDGHDVSLPLRWSGIPTNTTAIALVMRDPDAPGGNFIHWRLSGIPAGVRGLDAGAFPPPPGIRPPRGLKVGRNDFGTLGYRGPCPPAGATHHYLITVTATAGTKVVGSGTLTGTYARR